jgi:hypothetical protein
LRAPTIKISETKVTHIRSDGLRGCLQRFHIYISHHDENLEDPDNAEMNDVAPVQEPDFGAGGCIPGRLTFLRGNQMGFQDECGLFLLDLREIVDLG